MRAPRSADLEFLEAHQVLDELFEDHRALMTRLRESEARVDARGELRDCDECELDRRLGDLVGDLQVLCDALGKVHGEALDARLERLFMPNSPLADYVRGAYAWAHAMVRALDELVRGAQYDDPDVALFDRRIEEARNFLFEELEGAILWEVAHLAAASEAGAFGPTPPPVDALREGLTSLFSIANDLDAWLDEPFA